MPQIIVLSDQNLAFAWTEALKNPSNVGDALMFPSASALS